MLLNLLLEAWIVSRETVPVMSGSRTLSAVVEDVQLLAVVAQLLKELDLVVGTAGREDLVCAADL